MILIRLHFLMKTSVAKWANVCARRALGGLTGDETGEGGKVLAEGLAAHAKVQAAIKNPLQERVFKGH